MADDTMEARGIPSVRWNDHPVKLREAQADGEDLKACMLVTVEGETNDYDIDLCADGERATAIVWTRYDTDKDTAYADNDPHVPIALFSENGGLGVWAFVSATVAVVEEALYRGNAGLVDDYTAGTDDDDLHVLQGAENVAADASYKKLRKFIIE
jgi:hypothetical protein